MENSDLADEDSMLLDLTRPPPEKFGVIQVVRGPYEKHPGGIWYYGFQQNEEFIDQLMLELCTSWTNDQHPGKCEVCWMDEDDWEKMTQTHWQYFEIHFYLIRSNQDLLRLFQTKWFQDIPTHKTWVSFLLYGNENKRLPSHYDMFQ